MAISYTQTNTAMACAEQAYCTGTVNTTSTLLRKQAQAGGTPGTVETTLLMAGSATARRGVHWEIVPAAGVSWDAGTWTIRFNVTTANMNVVISAIYLCRVSSGCVNQATIGSATGLALSMGTVGVVSQNISGAAQT